MPPVRTSCREARYLTASRTALTDCGPAKILRPGGISESRQRDAHRRKPHAGEAKHRPAEALRPRFARMNQKESGARPIARGPYGEGLDSPPVQGKEPLLDPVPSRGLGLIPPLAAPGEGEGQEEVGWPKTPSGPKTPGRPKPPIGRIFRNTPPRRAHFPPIFAHHRQLPRRPFSAFTHTTSPISRISAQNPHVLL